MREFERARRDSAGTDSTEQWYPEDFSADEAEFASELRELFPLEEEVLPPHFIQTVIEDEWRAPTPPGFEQKLTYNVFSRLRLPRGPLFPQHPRAPWQTGRRAFPFTRVTRPVAVSLSVVVMLMIFSVIVASPSFAAGMQLLLANTGVRQVNHYPSQVHAPTAAHVKGAEAASDTLTTTFPISWLGPNADQYVFSGMRLLPAAQWSDGPIVQMQYSLPGDSPGTGIIDIREFKVSPNYAAVLQVVQTGSATWLNVNGVPAVYVDGTWLDPVVHQQPMMESPVWQSGVRSELMIERDGVVFWIVGDQRDGANQQELAHLASMLTVAENHKLHPYPITLHGLGESFMQIFQNSRGREVYYLVPRGSALTTGTGIYFQSSDISY